MIQCLLLVCSNNPPAIIPFAVFEIISFCFCTEHSKMLILIYVLLHILLRASACVLWPSVAEVFTGRCIFGRYTLIEDRFAGLSQK